MWSESSFLVSIALLVWIAIMVGTAAAILYALDLMAARRWRWTTRQWLIGTVVLGLVLAAFMAFAA
jgi:hypothetical protein